MRMIGVLHNSRIPQACALADEVKAWLKERGLLAQGWTTDEALDGLPLEGVDMVVTLGGDGSILRAALAAAPHATLILGINLGRVGFLTEAEPETWREVLSRALVGDYWIEERMMLRASALREGQVIAQAQALNDIVVGRGAQARLIRLRAEIDGGCLATYVADGLIVATPTGSTAYALAAGGPVLPPQLRNILLVPVAPHLSMARPVVLAEGVTVRVTVVGERPAVLTVDGESRADLEVGDEVHIEAAPRSARFARVREQTYFYKTLASRLSPRE